MSNFLYARKSGYTGTYIIEIDKISAIEFMKNNKNISNKMGIIGGKNINNIKKVYGEYAPFKIVNSLYAIKEAMKEWKTLTAFLIWQLGRSSEYDISVVKGKDLLKGCFEVIESVRDLIVDITAAEAAWEN